MKRFIKNAINVEPIREYMAKNRLNIRDFSKVCGVSQRVLDKILDGSAEVRLTAIIKIARAIGVNFVELFNDYHTTKE